MKTWEMLRILEENPDKVFESRHSLGMMKCRVDRDFFEFEGKGRAVYRVLLDRKWSEVVIPLKFEDVVELVGSKVRDCPMIFKLNLDDITLDGSLDEIMYQLGTSYGSYIISKFITQGKWYVK